MAKITIKLHFCVVIWGGQIARTSSLYENAQTRAKQQPKTLVSPTFRPLCCCRVAYIYSSARRVGVGGGGYCVILRLAHLQPLQVRRPLLACHDGRK